jgi:type I restriction enzyme, S subunit
MQTLKLVKKYETYSEYKYSGVEWFGNFPKDWQVGPLRSVLIERIDKNKKLVSDNILSVMKDIGVIRYADKGDVGNKSSDRPENYKIVQAGDIVLNSMNLVIGSVGQSKELGVTSSVYIIYYPRNNNVSAEYYHYLFRNKSWQKTLGRLGKGIMELRESINSDALKIEPVPIPPLIQQKKIVSYLDQKTIMIDEIINKKQKLIELLQEKRTAVINNAVTKGLDPKIKLINSGISWIGNIPEKWEIKRLKDVSSYCSRGSSPEYTEDESKYKFINQSCIRDGFLDLEKIKYSLSASQKGNVKKGDILINSTGTGTLGRLSVFNESEEYFADTHVTIYRPSKINSSFAMYLIQNPAWQNYLYASSVTGSTNQIELSRNKFLEIPVILPSVNEQKEIVFFLDDMVKKYDKALTYTQQSIELLQEFKNSLISNVVTGKIKI